MKMSPTEPLPPLPGVDPPMQQELVTEDDETVSHLARENKFKMPGLSKNMSRNKGSKKILHACEASCLASLPPIRLQSRRAKGLDGNLEVAQDRAGASSRLSQNPNFGKAHHENPPSCGRTHAVIRLYMYLIQESRTGLVFCDT